MNQDYTNIGIGDFDNDYITINQNGVSKEAEILSCFQLNGKDDIFVIYSFGDLDDSGMNIMHASKLIIENGTKKFNKIEDDDWKRVKNIMINMVEQAKEEE